jgi:polar amino acid transport system substrate-binding protein
MHRANRVVRHVVNSQLQAQTMSSTAKPSSAVVQEMAPHGSLRVAINMRNALLVTGKTEAGDPTGLAASMGAAMAERLGVPVTYVQYENAGKLADDAAEDNWDVGLIGADPLRATYVDFTTPYCQIEASYVIPENSDIKHFAELDQKGKRIVGAKGAAYVAWLQRNLKAAELTQVDGHDETYKAFLADGYDAIAGLRSKLKKDEAKLPGTKLMDGVLMAVEQAACTKKVRVEGFKWLQEFIDETKTSGKVLEFMKEFGVSGELSIP